MSSTKLLMYCPTPSQSIFPRMSFSSPRRHRPRRRLKKPPFSQPNPKPDPDALHVVLDVQHYFKNKTSNSLQNALDFFESNLSRISDSANDAYLDLQTLITVDPVTNNMVVSYRPSTLKFLGGFFVSTFVAVAVFRAVLQLGLGFRRWARQGSSSVEGVITRRDRSLGGREVVVGARAPVVKEKGSRDDGVRDLERFLGTGGRKPERRREAKLPRWWPAVASNASVMLLDAEGYQRAANRLIRAMMDEKMSGKDISEADILELRQICRISGVKAIIETVNTRNTLYRSSVDFVINTASDAGRPSIEINGEDPRVFVAGLADNIGLTASRAAAIVSGAVAARTRLWFLQAWASEIQGRHSKALEELSRICVIHQLFPPEPASPEMEMVALGLEKHLKREEREFLLNALVEVCGEDSSRMSASEALGLVYSPDAADIQHEQADASADR